MATISCRVKNRNSAIVLLNPNGDTIYFDVLKGTKGARFELVKYSSNELTVSLSNVSLSDKGRCARTLHSP
ncbi:hypothetical protein CgunFtcFv8_026748 [Champsocephalus gunnari]|uniref:Uncharacterized protein n=1 Tax=Champsocephalus gunnari TaxID=52237 RepID=A0AAN8DWB0_CHAGU|nr:hypothetical protein CgunFtcFv8_026748 [Champsocephalus gunnari]